MILLFLCLINALISPNREGDAFLIVYSITQQQSFARIAKFKEQINRVKDNADIPIVVVGNKMDQTSEREVSIEEGKAMARRMGCEFGMSTFPFFRKRLFTILTFKITLVTHLETCTQSKHQRNHGKI